MLLQTVTEFGKNMVENGQYPYLAWWHTNIDYTFVINRCGRLLQIKKHELGYKLPIPLTINQKPKESKKNKGPELYAFPSSRDAVDLWNKFPLFESIKLLTDQNYKDEYLEMLKELCDEISIDNVNAIAGFIEKNDLKELLIANGFFLKENATNFFVVEVQEKGDNYQIWADMNACERVNRYLLKKISSLKSAEKDIVGNSAENMIYKHSRFMGREHFKARIITSMQYNRHYGGRENKEYSHCRIGALTELYFNAGFSVLLNKSFFYGINKHYFSMADVQSGDVFYLDLRWRRFCKKNFDADYKVQDYEKLKQLITAREWSLIYLEFDSIHKSRISTYKVYSYDEKESKELLLNFLDGLRWLNSVGWKTDTHYFFLIDELWSGMFTTDKNAYYDCQQYSYLIELLFCAEYLICWERFLKPIFMRAVKDNFVNKAKSLLKARIDLERRKFMDNEIKSMSYVAGELIGYAYLIERHYRYQVFRQKGQDKNWYEYISEVEKVILNYEKSPYRIWIFLRAKIEQMKTDTRDIGYKILYKKMCEKESYLLTCTDFCRSHHLGGEMYVGYDCCVFDYLKEQKHKFDETSNDSNLYNLITITE